jgi:hypothetical protein
MHHRIESEAMGIQVLYVNGMLWLHYRSKNVEYSWITVLNILAPTTQPDGSVLDGR